MQTLNINLHNSIDVAHAISDLYVLPYAVVVGREDKPKAPLHPWKKVAQGKETYTTIEEAIQKANEYAQRRGLPPEQFYNFALVLLPHVVDVDKDIPVDHPLNSRITQALFTIFKDVDACSWGRKGDAKRHILIKLSDIPVVAEFTPAGKKGMSLPFVEFYDQKGEKIGFIEFANHVKPVTIPPAFGDYVFNKFTGTAGTLTKAEFLRRYWLVQATALLWKYYNSGYRHFTCLYMATFMRNLGFDRHHFELLVQALEAMNPGKDPLDHRLSTWDYTVGKIEEGGRVKGFPALAEEVLKPQRVTQEEIDKIYAILTNSKVFGSVFPLSPTTGNGNGDGSHIHQSQRKSKQRRVLEGLPANIHENHELLEALKRRYDELITELKNRVIEDEVLWTEREVVYALPSRMLEFGGVKLVIGSSRSGKSYFMVNLACVYAKGEGEILGVPFRLSAPLKVLYLALDEQEDIVRRKVRNFLTKEEWQSLRSSGRLDFVYYHQRLKDYESLLAFETFVSGYDVVVIDMLNDLYLPANLALASQMNWWFLNYFKLVCRLTGDKITFFVLDHTAVRPNATTAEEKARGGNALVGKAVDFILLEARKSGTLQLHISSRYTGHFEFPCERDPETGKLYLDEYKFAHYAERKDKIQPFVSEGRTKDLIIGFFIANKNSSTTIQEIVSALGISRDTVKKVLQRNPDVFVIDKKRSTERLYYYNLSASVYEVAKNKEVEKFKPILDLFHYTPGKEEAKKKQKQTTPLYDEEEGEEYLEDFGELNF